MACHSRVTLYLKQVMSFNKINVNFENVSIIIYQQHFERVCHFLNVISYHMIEFVNVIIIIYQQNFESYSHSI